jgi:uncharacterized membrane protein
MKTITDYVKISLLALVVLVAMSVVATAQAIPPPPPPTGPPPPPHIPPPPGSNAPPYIPPGAYVITATPTTLKSGIQTNVTFTVFYDNQPVRDVMVGYSGFQIIGCGSNYANCSTGTTDANGTVTLSVKAPSLCPAEIDCDKIGVSATTYGHSGETELTVIHQPIDKIEQILLDIVTYIITFLVIILVPPPNQFLAIILIPFFLAKRYFPRIDAKYGNLFDDNFIIALIPYTIFFSIFRALFILTETTELTTGFLSQNSYLFYGPLGILRDIVFYVLLVFITAVSFLLTKSTATKLNLQNWRLFFGVAGVALSVISFALLMHFYPRTFEFSRPEIILLIIGAATGFTFLIYNAGRYFSFSLLTNKLNASIIWAYILNILSIYVWMESVRHISLDYLIPVFIETGGYDWMYLTLPILWILNARFINSDNFRNLLKLIILYIGLAPATRIFIGL